MTDAPRPPVGQRAVGDRADPPTLPIPVQTVVKRRRRRRRVLVGVLIALVVLVIAGVVAFMIGDRVLRASAERQIETSVFEGFPKGVTGDVRATVGGGSAIVQYLHGSFDDVTLTTTNLTVVGAPADATIRIHGLPVSGGKVDAATATFTIGQDAFRNVPQLRNVGASAPRLGNGTVSTTLSRTFLSLPLKVAVVMKPSLSGQTVKLTTSSATLTAGPATIPATAIVQQLLPNGVSVCAAEYLPRGIDVTSVAFRKGEAVVGLKAKGIDLQSLDTTRTGTCR